MKKVLFAFALSLVCAHLSDHGVGSPKSWGRFSFYVANQIIGPSFSIV